MTLTPEIPSSGPGAANDASQKNPLGIVTIWKGEKYRYVLHNAGTGSVATAAKYPAYWKTLDPDGDPPTAEVTADQTDSLFGTNVIAGFYQGVITDGNYTWLKISGEQSVTVAGTVAGDKITGSTTDGEVARITAAGNNTGVIFGVCKSGTTSGSPTVLLQNMDW